MTQLDFVEPEPEFVMERARWKPVDVVAVQASTGNLSRIVDWIKDQGHHAVLGEGQLTIQALDGPATVRPGDYVIQGRRGAFSRCDSEIFTEDFDILGPVES